MTTGVRLLSEADVERIIDPQAAIAVAEKAFIAHSTSTQPQPARLDLRRTEPRAGMLVLAGFSERRIGILKSNMHSYTGDPPSRNTASLLAVWDMIACKPIALISTRAFNGHRTASGFAAAARALARPNARTLTVFGTGHLAPWTIRYLAMTFPLNRILIVGRNRAKADQLARRMSEELSERELEIAAEADTARATECADIIATVTSSDTPVFPGSAVRPGTFVLLGGANRPTAREADDELASRTTFYLDHREGCLERAGDICIPIACHALRYSQLAGEIGTLLAAGSAPLRHDVLAFKSLGIAPQDLALAQYVLERATAMNLGARFDPESGVVRT